MTRCLLTLAPLALAPLQHLLICSLELRNMHSAPATVDNFRILCTQMACGYLDGS